MVLRKQITKNQREKFAEKILEWGNLVFVGLVIAQIVPETDPFRLHVAIIGVISFTSAYLTALFIMKGGGEK